MGRKSVTNHFSFVYFGKPESYNADSKRKQVYKKRLSSAYKRRFSGMIAKKELYAAIYYFYREDVGLDADNISKPAWDALNAVGYSDDKQIKIRTAVAINLCEHDILVFDQDILPTDVLIDLIQSIADNNHTLYIEVGEIDRYDNIFNISQLWK